MRMKRFVSVLAAAVMVFGVTGCNAITIDGETENVSGEAAGNGSIGRDKANEKKSGNL